MGAELREEDVYCPPMVDKSTLTAVSAGWLDVLAESEADLAAGLTVDGDQIVRELYAAADRLEAELMGNLGRKAPHRR